MAKKKLVHFRENLTFPHLFQPCFSEIHDGFPLRAKWGSSYFRNAHPIVIELGCGKGEYTVGLARKNPELNFIGIDVKGARLWRGAKTAWEEKLLNVAFIRQRVDFVEQFFGPGEISEIWITFPDPQKGKERKRLTSPRFLEKYKNILCPEGVVHLKTDDLDFFRYTLDVLQKNRHEVIFDSEDLYHCGYSDDQLSIRTHYESVWLEQEKKICYLKFALR